MTFDLSELNPQQRKAVNIVNGSVLVIAGAGSGKTKTLTYRIANLIYHKYAKPYEILAITFTNKAARELVDRVHKILNKTQLGDERYGSVEVSTFHKFGVRLLRRYANLIGREFNFSIYDKNDSENVLKQILKEKGLSINSYPTRWLVDIMSEMKNNFLTFDEIEKIYPKETQVIQDIFKQYEERLLRANAFDLDDLLCIPVKLMKMNEELLLTYRRRIQYIHVDEYQDTNQIQLELLKLLDGDRSIVFAVGDVDQAIYGWRGANIRNILSFHRDFANVQIVKLEQNYRSTPGILRSANAVIEKNLQRQSKILWTKNLEGEKIKFIAALDPTEEACKTIQWLLLDQKGTKSILFRTNAQSFPFEQYCIENNIPYKLVGTVRFFERKEIKDAMSYIRILEQPDDDIAFERALSFPNRGIGKITLDRIRQLANQNGSSLFQTIQAENFYEVFGKRVPKQLSIFIDDLLKLQRMISSILNPTIAIRNWLINNGFMATLKSEKDGDERLRNLDMLFSQLHHYFSNHNDAKLLDFIEFVTLQSEQDTIDETEQSILLMTCHAAKGLEFDSVVVVGLEETLFPLGDEYSKDLDLEEERRLFYVAMTRAKRRLAISRAFMRNKYGIFEKTTPSRFLYDIPLEEVDGDKTEMLFQERVISSNSIKKSNITTSLNNHKNNITEFYEGQKIHHSLFGFGKILRSTKYEDGFKIVVDFDNVGVKTLLTQYTNITIQG
ncbi:MAG: UvrD-helicase domain-containing protein [bacterium]|nr:UvrD-helicase domain-containing protein [bacterium]